MEVIDKEPDPQTKIEDFTNGFVVKPFSWRSYNNSQMREKYFFLKLLKDLLKTLERDQTPHLGRPPLTSTQMIFCMCTKVYTNFSSRRVISDLTMCQRLGYIKSVPSFNSILNYFNNESITKKLKYLIQLSCLPLAQLEKSFSVDASGISSRKYLPRWSHVKQKYEKHRDYKKVHIIVRNYSNAVASVIVTDGKKGDSPYFKQLLQEAAKNFDIAEICGDKAYLSRDNLKFADDLGITPFIPFKTNSKGPPKGARIWNKMYKYFKENPMDFAKHYHKRSNVESTFFMIKQKFNGFNFTKNYFSQINEILCKILCHNICVLIQEMFLSNVDVNFLSYAKVVRAQK